MLTKKLNWRDNWGRYLAPAALMLAVLGMIRGGVPPELAIGIPVALLLISLPGLYYMARDRRRQLGGRKPTAGQATRGMQ